jgi:hypothetical protein
MSGGYDCQACGACCVQLGPYDGNAYVYLDRDEAGEMQSLGLPVGRTALGSFCLGAAPRGRMEKGRPRQGEPRRPRHGPVAGEHRGAAER